MTSENPIRTKGWSDNYTAGKEEKDILSRVIDSGYMSLFEGSHTPDHPFRFDGGPFVREFEEMIKERMNTPHAISVNSATSGLYAAIGALGVGFGDEVIVSPYTMSACATAPLVYGAIPIFADVDINTGSLLPESIEDHITERTKAILVVHQFGIPADMKRIMEIAKKHKLTVIEDCAQAWDAKIGDQHVGTFGDIGVFSLNVNKTIQTGEGGVCVTNDKELAYRLQLIRNHGEAVVDKADYNNITNIIGYNYRLTELQAAVGIEQLKKLSHINQARLELVHYMKESLEKYDFISNLVAPEDSSATYYIFPFRYLEKENKGLKREDFISQVNKEGILFYQGYVKPLYFQKIYQTKQAFKNGYPWSAVENKESETNYFEGACPNAEQLHFKEMVINEHIRLPHTKDDMNDILKAIEKVSTNN